MKKIISLWFHKCFSSINKDTVGKLLRMRKILYIKFFEKSTRKNAAGIQGEKHFVQKILMLRLQLCEK